MIATCLKQVWTGQEKVQKFVECLKTADWESRFISGERIMTLVRVRSILKGLTNKKGERIVSCDCMDK